MRIYVGVLNTRRDMYNRITESFGKRLIREGIPQHILDDLQDEKRNPWWINIQIRLGELTIGPGMMEFIEKPYEHKLPM